MRESWCVVNKSLPYELAIRRIDGVRVAANIPEVCDHLVGVSRPWLNQRGAGDAALRLERPIDTAGRLIQRIQVPGIAADEYAAAGDRRLAVNG